MKTDRGIFGRTYVLYKWWRTWRTIPVLSWIRAAALYRAGRFESAEKFYRRGLDANPAHPAQYCARLDLAYCLFRNGKLEDAEKQLRYVSTRVKNGREAYLRLARLQLWSGRALEAAWTIRKVLHEDPRDSDVVATFMLAVLIHGGPKHLLNEANQAWRDLNEEQKRELKLRAVRARFSIVRGEDENARAELETIAMLPEAPFEAILCFAETLLEEGKLSHARMELRRAMMLEPTYPRVLSMFAEIYLRSGPFYNPEYACQLASSACQNGGWLSARDMHILAESYYHSGDNVSALIMAQKAKAAGSKLLGEYRYVANLERLIEALSNAQTAWVKSKML